MMTAPISDMLPRIRNAGIARHDSTRCPASKLKLEVANLLKEEGFLTDVSVDESGRHPQLVLGIRYDDSGATMIDGIRRVSRPGRRVYASSGELPKVRNGLGGAVISTSKGVLSDRAARSASVGGEVLCEVW